MVLGLLRFFNFITGSKAGSQARSRFAQALCFNWEQRVNIYISRFTQGSCLTERIKLDGSRFAQGLCFIWEQRVKIENN